MVEGKGKTSLYDCVIIGAGPAGISAAIYTSRAKLRTLLIGKYKEGALYKAHIVANYFGFDKDVTGPDIVERAVRQAQRFGTEVLEDEVVNMTKEKDVFTVKTANSFYVTSKTVIIATGTAYKIAGAKNEQALSGKGVHYCAVCDGYWYKQKKIAVLGAANHAAEEAITLLSYTKDITIFSNSIPFAIAPALRQHLEKNAVQFRTDKIVSFEGNKQLESVVLENGTKEHYDGVFVALGVTTALNFATKLGLRTEKNYLVIDRDGKTSADGVFAGGNCTGGNAQAANSVGEGCNAALSVIKYLRGVDVYIDYS